MHLPDPARYARDAASAIGAVYEDLDNGGGYLFRVSRGGRHVVSGAGAICSYPINTAAAVAIARDKSHAKSVLQHAGLPVIPGGLFFAHDRRIRLRGPGREIPDALRYANQIGFPLFAKPNLGGRGQLAEIIADRSALQAYIPRLAVEYESFLLEPLVSGAEHRIVIQDGRALFWAEKAPPCLIGDGASSLAALLAQRNERLAEQGLSPDPDVILDLGGGPSDRVMPAGASFPLPGRRNLSARGDIARFSTVAPHALQELAAAACAAIGLRVGAVDVFDVSPGRNLSDLVVIEVNGNPGLKTLELVGRYDLVVRLWSEMLTEALGR
jgi:D-alanine-D-alanine ligase-like ATP-grasp enzyme